MRFRHSLMSLLALSLLSPLVARAQTGAPTNDPLAVLAVLAVLAAEMRERGAPGAAIAIVVGDSVVLATGLGVRSVEDGGTVDATTLFRVGSVTKAITGLTALVLARQGTIDLDAPIARTIPELSPALGAPTLRQLLEHRAGLWNEAAADGRHDDAALGARIATWRDDRLFAAPGDVHSYSSPGYWLAGRVLERAAGSAYPDVVARTLLAPLGMSRSVFRPTTALTYPLALDHVRDSGRVRVLRPFPDDASTWPSGSLFTSVQELARLAIALLGEGRVGGRQALPREVPALVFHGGSRAGPGGDCTYAFGLQRCRRGAVHTVSHYGFRRGSGAVFTLVPERRVAVIVLANGPGAIMTRTEAAALSRYAGIVPDSSSTPAPVGPLNADVLGAYIAGADTLRLFARGDSTYFAYNGQSSERAWRAADGTILVGPRSAPSQQFHLVQGDVTGTWFLHDGLGAYRRADR